MRGLSWAARPEGPALRGEYAQFRVQGLPGDFIQTDSLALARSPGAPNASLKGRAERFQFTLPYVFEQPTVKVGELDVDAQVKGPDARDWFVDIAELRVRNEDLDARLQGQWRAEGKTAAGSADLRGVMIRGAMPAIHRYLPLTVNPDAREWLATGLPAGEMRSAAITLKGDLDDFLRRAGRAGRIRHRGRVRRRDRGLCPRAYSARPGPCSRTCPATSASTRSA
ncbi:DUF3971 domain-containing protein [Achromobacter xylosoxidans]